MTHKNVNVIVDKHLYFLSLFFTLTWKRSPFRIPLPPSLETPVKVCQARHWN